MTAVFWEHGWSDVARLRQGLYRFFAAALLPPDPERLAGLTAGVEWLNAAGIEAFAFAGPWQALATAVEEGALVDPLETEYVRLFVASVEPSLCPPVESSYGASPSDIPGILSSLDLTYRVGGMVRSPSVSTPSDHVVTELEFMSVLCDREAQAWQADALDDVASVLDDEWPFLHQHLGRWVPEFARQLSRSTTVAFYRALGEAMGAFVQHDLEWTKLLRQSSRKKATR